MSSPWTQYLPTSVNVSGKEYNIRSDYRAILDICTALNDPELSDGERAACVLAIFYPDFETIPPSDYDAAIAECFRFINCGESERPSRKNLRLVNWEKDFNYIVAPINRVLGKEVRAAEYMHWWTFIAAYYEIGGDCLFAQIVHIRNLLQSGKPLDKQDREWYQKNRDLVDIREQYTEKDDEALKEWLS